VRLHRRALDILTALAAARGEVLSKDTCTRKVRMSSLSNIEMSASFHGEPEADSGLGGDERA
jgi:hypothetical protein